MNDLERFAGVDWGSENHQVCITSRTGAVLGERVFRHGGAGLAEMADWIAATAAAEPHVTGVAIEVPHGPVVETLMERGFRVHSINPKQLDRFRDRFSPAGAKDDRRDARVLADALRTDAHAFRRLDPVAPEVVELREWSRIASDLTADRTRLVNRARQQLWRYYPQLLEVESDLTRAWVRELWKLAPTPVRARRLRVTTVNKLLKRHRVRRLDGTTVLKTLRGSAVVVAAGTHEAAVAHLEVVFAQLDVVVAQLARAGREIDRLTARLTQSADNLPGQQGQRDVAILSSLPGVGRIVLATLLAEAHDPLRRRDYQALRCLSGVAPVTRRSGKAVIVVRRLAAHNRLQDAVYHWANVALQHDTTSRTKYANLRTRGHGHARALRSVADRLLAVACAMLESQTMFNPNIRSQHHGS
ncbi:MAG: IS110 family transposase [Gammaproteobacteria bacterium]|nr:IS110 family transposase [Gammaproteobacteria bacterium]